MPKVATTIDEELYDGLQQARKKKPRYYAMIAKGPEVVGLIVQKKIINDSLAQKAKSENKGNLIIQGVCHGEGVDLKFEVLGVEPSITPKKIKEFIDEQTELTLKPQWAVVTQLSVVVDEEKQAAAAAAATVNGAGDPFAAFQARVREVGSAVAQLKDSNPFREGLQQRLNTEVALVGSTPANVPGGLKTLATLDQEAKVSGSFATRATEVFFAIEKLAEQDPVRGQLMYSWNAEINSARNTSATALEYVPAALERLAALERQVQTRLPAAMSQPATSQAPAQTPVQQAAVNATALQDRLKSLLLRAKGLFAKDPSSRENLLPVAQATSELVMKNNPNAVAALDKLEQMLNGAEKGQATSSQHAAPAVTASDPKQQQWFQEHARIEPLYLAFLSGNPAEATKIRAVMAYCTGQAEAGVYDKALVGLKRLEPFLNASAPATAKTPEAKSPETKTAEAPAAAASADGLRQQLADLRMQLEKMVGDATPDQLSQVLALQETAGPLVNSAFAHLEANKLAEAAASIEALRKLLGGKPQSEPAAMPASEAEPKADDSNAAEPVETASAAVSQTATNSADNLRQQLADLRMQLETKLGDAPPDQLSQVMALQEQAEPLVKKGFAHLEANKLEEAAASIESLRKLLGGSPQTEPAATSTTTAESKTAEPAATSSATAESKVAEPAVSATTDEPESVKPETTPATPDATAFSADELRKQLAALRLQLESKLGDAAPDQLSQVMALQGQAEPLVKEGFAHLEANKLAEAAASIEALRKLLGGKPQAEPTAQSATTPEPKVAESVATAATAEPKSTEAGTPIEAGTPVADEAASTADELRKQLAELRMQLEKMLGEAAPDQLSEVMALQELAEPLVKESFALLEGGKLAEAATTIEALEKLLGGESQAAAATESSAPAADKAAEAKPDTSSQPAGVEVSKADFPRLWQAAQDNWRDAVDTINDQLEKLRVKLLSEADPELAPLKEQLKQIGEVGLNAITANQRSRLQAALMDVNQAAGPAQAKSLAKAQELVAAFRKHIESDGRAAACDDNPWDVTVSIRGTFGPALQQLSQALSAGLKA